MKEILRVLNKDLERRNKNAKQFFEKYCKLDEENNKLKRENEMLRKDLQELSKQYFKK